MRNPCSIPESKGGIALRHLGTIWLWCLVGLILALARTSLAQELEPRRWTHLPRDTNFAAAAYAYTSADIAFDPVLLIDGGATELHTGAAGYIRSFELFGKSARADFIQAYKYGEWAGVLNGVPTSISRTGWADTAARFAINLYGAPPLAGGEYAAYRTNTPVETIVGIALAAQIPTGDYMNDKLINLGANRFMFRPELGVVHNRGAWSFEATAGVSFFTENDEFFNGNRLEQDPLVGLQGHVVYTFRPGLWAATSAGYEVGGISTVNGVSKDDRKENLMWAFSVGYPITRQWGIKLAYIGIRKSALVGIDADTVAIGLSTFW